MEKVKITAMIYDLRFKIYEHIKRNWLLIAILILGAFLRLYKIDEYMTFLGDEGRDAIIVRNLIVKADPILIGPGTSVGGMYLGPLYYYFMAPFLFLFNFSPVGPAYGVALLGIITIWLIYYVTKKWFSKKAAILGSFLYAISPTVIIFSRSSWNPNIMPFFALVLIYSLWQVWIKNNYYWLVISAVSFTFILQSHYMGLLMTPVILLIWIFKLLSLEVIDNWKTGAASFVRASFISFLIFLFLMSPLLIFDMRHDWINLNALKVFLSSNDPSISSDPWFGLSRLPEIASNLFTRLIAGRNEMLGKILLAFVSIPSLLIILGRKELRKNEPPAFALLFLWIGFGIIGLGMYKESIYDHYLGFLFPSIFILFAGFSVDIYENLSKTGKVFFGLFIAIIIWFNIIENPLKFNPNRQMQRAQNVAEKVMEIASNKPFNLAVLADRNYEDGYQYFLETKDAQVVEIDSQISQTITNQLFVICEMPKEKCDPTHSPKAEVANFGWSKIEGEYEVDGVIIYKLIHSE